MALTGFTVLLTALKEMDNIQQITDAIQEGLHLTNCEGQRPARKDQANTLAHRAIKWFVSRCVSLEVWAGQMSILYNNGDGCCL